MRLRKLMIELGIMVGAALVFALLGPFGTSAYPLMERFLRWLLFAVGGYAFFRPVIAGGNAFAAQSELPRWFTAGIACVIAALPTTLLVAWSIAGVAFGRVNVAFLAGLYPNVLLAGGIVTAAQFALRTEDANADGERAVVPPSAAPLPQKPDVARSRTLLDLLPPALGEDVLYLENEDHYVRVHTARGDTLLLMRMRDAAAALDGFDGMRVHRSWWVARGAVVESVKRDRATLLRLFDGREVPIARSMLPALRAAGWL